MLTSKLMTLQENAQSLKHEGKYIEAIEIFNKLLEVGMNENNHSAMLTAYVNNAESYYYLGDMEEALISIEAHNELCLHYGDETEWMNSYHIRFLLHNFNKEFDQAKKVLQKSIEFGKRLKHYNVVSNGYSNYSHVAHELEDFPTALKMGQLGLEFANLYEPFCPLLAFRSKLNIANAYISLQQLDAATQVIDEIWNEKVFANDDKDKAKLYIIQARLLEASGQLQAAFDAYSAANNIMKLYEDFAFLKAIQRNRLQIAESLMGINRAYILQKEYIELIHSIEAQELEKKARQLELQLKLSSIENKANTDYLTGLYNRSYIEQTTNMWLNGNRKGDASITCIAFDIDNLKTTNDTYGHLMGDKVIKQVAHACKQTVRKKDLLGRFGGDEFVLIMHGATLENGYQTAAQLIEAIQHVQVDTGTDIITVTASIGISNSTQMNVLNFKELFHLADNALYRAKENGKNQIAH